MPDTDPPADLTAFPSTELRPSDPPLYRIVQARDPETGEPRTPWFFSSLPSERQGRFDPPTPDGSCYLSDRMSGAWLEVFRNAGLVDREDVERRRLVRASRSGGPVKVANLRAPQARPFGVTNDLVAGDDYARPQAWAAALRACGFKGLVATARHDPTASALNVALFGRAGARTRPSGWHTEVGPLISNAALMNEVAQFGTGILTRPYDVPLTDPPD